MTRSHKSLYASGRLHQIALSLMLASAQSAWAEANPYYIGVSQSVTRNSNVFRTPNDQADRGDTISSTGLNAGIDQPFRLQPLLREKQSEQQQLRFEHHTGMVDRWEVVRRVQLLRQPEAGRLRRAEYAVHHQQKHPEDSGICSAGLVGRRHHTFVHWRLFTSHSRLLEPRLCSPQVRSGHWQLGHSLPS